MISGRSRFGLAGIAAFVAGASILFAKGMDVFFNNNIEPVPAQVGEALEILSGLPAGRSLLDKALGAWNANNVNELHKVFKLGHVSHTDAVLVRQLDPRTGREVRTRKVNVYLKAGQPIESLVLDMAHELVHATTQPVWDPYDPTLTAVKYISFAIEGVGGEVEAMIAECKVSMDFARKYGISSGRCSEYLVRGGETIDREKIRRDFYKIGKWKDGFVRNFVGHEASQLPLLSSQPPKLYSSTGQAPYPIALLYEFEELTRIACDNSKKRRALLVERSVASVHESVSHRATNDFLKSRCR
ncbi:MAG: hypothetical protein AABZ06_07105 [Bdellovibrionota bacterium]